MKNPGFEPVRTDGQDDEELFQVVKQGLYNHVDAIWGWSEDFQRERLRTNYEPEWFHWIVWADQRAGMICFKRVDHAIHVHLLLIFPEFQNQGLGRKVMESVREIAVQEKREKVTLSTFLRNVSATRFYQGMGYQVIGKEEHFLSLSLSLHSHESVL